MFVSNLAACEWYSIDSSKYFLEDEMKRWEKILHIKLAHIYTVYRTRYLYRKRQKSMEGKASWFIRFHPNVGKTFVVFPSSVLKVLSLPKHSQEKILQFIEYLLKQRSFSLT